MSRGKDPFHLIPLIPSIFWVYFILFYFLRRTSIILVRREICGIKITNGFKNHICKPYIIKHDHKLVKIENLNGENLLPHATTKYMCVYIYIYIYKVETSYGST